MGALFHGNAAFSVSFERERQYAGRKDIQAWYTRFFESRRGDVRHVRHKLFEPVISLNKKTAVAAAYFHVAQARSLSGLRLVLSPGVPGPWSEAAKGILPVKGIPYVCVHQEIGGENSERIEWTAPATAPVAAWNDEPPRSTWIELLFLAQRLQPAPSLIPDSLEERMLMIGY